MLVFLIVAGRLLYSSDAYTAKWWFFLPFGPLCVIVWPLLLLAFLGSETLKRLFIPLEDVPFIAFFTILSDDVVASWYVFGQLRWLSTSCL